MFWTDAHSRRWPDAGAIPCNPSHLPARQGLQVDAGSRVSLEWRLAAFVAVPPGGRQVVVERGMQQFKAAAAAVGQLGPVAPNE